MHTKNIAINILPYIPFIPVPIFNPKSFVFVFKCDYFSFSSIHMDGFAGEALGKPKADKPVIIKAYAG